MKPLWTSLASLARRNGMPGDINPPDHKQQSLRSVLMDMPVPERLYFPLENSAGDSARPLVNPGDEVLKGQLLAEGNNRNYMAVHASTSGRVLSIGPHPGANPTGTSQPMVTLAADREDRWLSLHGDCNWQSLAATEIVTRLRQAGITEISGAMGLDSSSTRSDSRRPDLLIINAVESEPFVTANHALLRSHATEVLLGARILGAATGASHCLLAIEDNRSDAIHSLRAALPGTGVELALLKPGFPLGRETRLVEALTGRQIPRGGFAGDVGIALVDAGTALASHDAILLGRPQVYRITTVSGDTLKTPKNFRVLLGAPVGFLLELCGVDYQRLDRLVMGGALTGFTLSSTDVPVVSTTNCLIAASVEELPPPPVAGPCIRCDFCVPACPAGLMPQLLYHSVNANRQEMAADLGLADCIECGACAYVCPARIPLVRYFRAGKNQLQQETSQRRLSAYRRQRFENRKARLARDAAMRRGSRRRSVARPENPEFSDSGLQTFSRERARREIADAVTRVRQRKLKAKPPHSSSRRDNDEDGT